MWAPPASSVLCLFLSSPRIGSLGVSVSQMGVRGFVLRQKTTMVVVTVSVGIASVVLGLVGVRSVAVCVDMRLHERFFGGGRGVGVVVLCVDMLSLGTLGIRGSTMGVTTVVRGVGQACSEGKGNRE